MDLNYIKNKLRESLIVETDTNTSTKKDYSDIRNALDRDKNPTAPTQVGVMKAIGLNDDEKGVNRSLFGKKLHQEKNDDGGLYQFDDDELARIRAVLDTR
jgi:hypothetical protein